MLSPCPQVRMQSLNFQNSNALNALSPLHLSKITTCQAHFFGELVTFNPSMWFNVTSPGQKVKVYEDTVGLDVTRNNAG